MTSAVQWNHVAMVVLY